MFVYLSKKVALPAKTHMIRTLSWNGDEGWIAVGGQGGLLKVIKLDPPIAPAPGQPPQSNLSMNQTLEGHHGEVTVVTWNEQYQKLTTSDNDGLIIVWMLHRNMWLEEMINNRNKSVVRDMKWTGDGQKICIVYEDGAVIVGSVEGNRLWGKDLQYQLTQIEWSPDSKLLLFGTPQGDVLKFDDKGKEMDSLRIQCLQGAKSELAGISWFNGGQYKAQLSEDSTQTSLCVCYKNGKLQLMKNEFDEKPIIVDTEMQVTSISWNNMGSILAISGQHQGVGVVQFYSTLGIHIRTLTVPATDFVSCVSWEGNGLRIALAVESVIYFANIKPDYKWVYFNNTLLYTYLKHDRPDHCVIFWDTKSDQKYTKYLKKLINVAGAGDYAVLATKAEDNYNQYVLILCNAIGSPIESKYINIEPLYIHMNTTHVVACSEQSIYVWQYRSQVSRLLNLELSKRKIGREIAFNIDETPDLNSIYDIDRFMRPARLSPDPATCVTVGDKFFLVGRVSGLVQKYSIPHVSLEAQYLLKCRPQMINVNCNATILSIIDIHGVLTFYDTTQGADRNITGTHLDIERKDVWDMKWSFDNPQMIAIKEKARMFVLTNFEPEEPEVSTTYLCDFKDLEIKAVELDDIMKQPDNPGQASDFIANFKTFTLKQTQKMIDERDIRDVFDEVQRNPHPKLWRMVAEAALNKLEFDVAHKAFVKCDDYHGISFTKKLKLLEDTNKQKAEVHVYFRQFDEAERIYRSMDRKDLALEMRQRIGDWLKVVQLLQEGVGSDNMFNTAYNSMGNHYSDRFRWNKAAAHYSLAQNNEMLIECYYKLEDFESLAKMVDILPEGSPLLNDIAEKLQGVGLCDEAVESFLKSGSVHQAIDCCVLLNNWNKAIELAEKYNFVQIEGLLSRYAAHLLEENKRIEAIVLYSKANRNTEAARLLNKIGKDMTKEQTNPVLLKKIFVMAALEVDSYKKRLFDAQMTGNNTTAQTLESLITSDINTMADKTLDNPWRGAEAFHFYLMAQRYLYEQNYLDALKAAMRLQEYENLLDTRDIYSLIALSAFYSKYYQECSKALVKLENLDGQKEEERQLYENLAVSIFTKHAPKDPPGGLVTCPGKSCSSQVSPIVTNCKDCGSNFPACIASGKPIHEKIFVQCRTCKHKAIEQELNSKGYRNCPLCHAVLRVRR